MKKTCLLIALLWVLTLLPFWQCLQAPFVYWDDPYYLLDNLSVRDLSPSGIQRIFTDTVSGTYVPLSVLSFAVEFHFFGLTPFVYHLNNLLLHLAIVALVFFLGRRLDFGEQAAFVAALIFGIHPMHVEAVAWVTSRKDLLYTFFFLSSILAYLRYIDRRAWRYYLLSLAAALLSILAKPMALTLPLALILIDWFKGRLFTDRSIWDKLPLFLIVIPIAWLTYRLHARLPGTDLGSSVLTWIWCLTFYIRKFLWPYPCLAIYKIPENFSHVSFDLAVILFILLIRLLIHVRKNRIWMFAFAFYFLNIFYLLRFDTSRDLQVVSDRYMYLASVGFCLLFGILFVRGTEFLRQKSKSADKILIIISSLLMVGLGFLSFRQCQLWCDEPALWHHTVRHNPSGDAYQKLGDSYFMRDKDVQAQPFYEEALRLQPRNYQVMTNLAIIYAYKWRLNEAMRLTNQALSIKSDYAGAYLNRGVLFTRTGQFDQALADISKAIELNPNRPIAYTNRGNIYTQMNRLDLAIRDYSQAIALDNLAFQAYYNRGLAYALLGDLKSAQRDFRETLRLNPNHGPARNNLNVVLKHQARPRGEFEDKNKKGK